MKKYFLISSLLAVTLFAHTCWANGLSQWVVLEKNDAQFITYYDSASIKADANHRQFWQVHVLLEPRQSTAPKTLKPSNTNSILIITTIDCDVKRGRIDEIRFYACLQAQCEPEYINTDIKPLFSAFDSDDAGDRQLLNAVCP